MSWITRITGIDAAVQKAINEVDASRSSAVRNIFESASREISAANDFGEAAVKEVEFARDAACISIAEDTKASLAAMRDFRGDAIDEKIHSLQLGGAYVIQVPEYTSNEDADKLRRAIESTGAYCIVVAAGTMNVITFSSKA